MQHEFIPFESIKRFSQGCVITEKIDGTNAQVFIPDDCSDVFAGSRNRWITPESDNYGFAKFVQDNKSELIKLGPGRHYGEWWGQGIQRTYGIQGKRFNLFNPGRYSQNRPDCCGIVPVLYAGKFSQEVLDKTMEDLWKNGSAIAPGFMIPEGVVVFMSDSKKLFKRTFDGDKHKGEIK